MTRRLAQVKFILELKVALITDGIWPYVMGGMQKHSYYLCKYLALKGIDVDLYHFNQSDLNIDALDCFSLEEKKHIRSIIIPFPKSVRFPGHYVFNSYRYSNHVFEVIKKDLHSYDFIYTKGFTGWYLINEKYKGNIISPPIGVKFHGYEMFQIAPDFSTKLQHLFLLRYPAKMISRKADVVFSYGGKITTLIESIGVQKEHIFELPSGIEEKEITDQIKETGETFRFVYLGRYERRKGIEELNKAISNLQSSKKNEFHFIGNIPDSKKLISPNAIYHGEIRDKHILYHKLKEMDVLLCPSYSEGFPNVILEAMSQGLAVAATPVGAVETLVNSENGFIISNASESEISRTINKILNMNASEIDLIKSEALRTIRKGFTWEILIEKLIKKIRPVV